MTLARRLRMAAGLAVLLALAAIAIVLVPPYVANWKLQRYVNELLDDPATASQPPETVRSRIVSKAASLGLPLHSEDVQVTPSGKALRIDALYVVHVDIAGYSVVLHFRPAGGGT
ncbi:MAG: DUF4845 domain-containing protein [Acidobacteriia bacterium]|nr:DUF4845 domain-containing protein [Terriglobia bacterium]